MISTTMPDPEYRAIRALSQSGAKSLMRSPALFAWEAEHGRPDTTAFDVGRATHAVVLGVGDPIVVGRDKNGEPFKDWRKNEAQAWAAKARADGATPLLLEQAEAVERMAAAIRSHPTAGRLLEAGRGMPEVSVTWSDGETGTAQRARLDWLIVDGDDGRPEIVDVKTCTDVRRAALVKTVDEHRYHWQHDQYLAGLAAHGVDARFRFVFVEKTPPHLVRVAELDADAAETGARFMAAARRMYAECLEREAEGHRDPWPAYPDQTELLGLPRYSPRDPEDVHL